MNRDVEDMLRERVASLEAQLAAAADAIAAWPFVSSLVVWSEADLSWLHPACHT